MLAERKGRWIRLGVAVGSGLLLSLCFPPFNMTGLVWVGLIPLFLALWDTAGKRRCRRRGFARGYLFGLAFWLVNIKWIIEVTWFGWLAVSAVLALYGGLFGMLVVWEGNPWREGRPGAVGGAWAASRRSLAVALVCALWWCGLEWVRGWFLTGFGWNGLGVAFHNTPVLAQSADLVGATGLSFLPVFLSAIVVQVGWRLHAEVRAGRLRPHWDFGVAMLVLAGAFAYGVVRLNFARTGDWMPLRVLMVQLNIPQEAGHVVWSTEEVHGGYEETTLRGLEEMAEEEIGRAEAAIESGEEAAQVNLLPDWVLWPESALKQALYVTGEGEQATGPQNNATLSAVREAGEFVLVMGLNEIEARRDGDLLIPREDGEIYNSLVALAPGRTSFDSYRKQHLVLFGETIPLRDQLPVLDKIFEAAAGVEFGGDFGRGSGADPLMVPVPSQDTEVAVIPSICFEDTVARHPRQFARNGGQLIVNVTNDGWFRESEAAAQHFANARFRAIELRRPLVRASNTGVTAVVDHVGRVEDYESGRRQVLVDEEGNHFTAGTLAATVWVPKDGGTTLYTLLGDWLGVLGAVAGVGLLARTRFKRGESRRVEEGGPDASR